MSKINIIITLDADMKKFIQRCLMLYTGTYETVKSTPSIIFNAFTKGDQVKFILIWYSCWFYLEGYIWTEYLEGIWENITE